MQMEFNTDRQMRDALYDCVKLLAKAKDIPIYAKATGKGVGDNCYHLTLADKEVMQHIVDGGGSQTDVYQADFNVPVPYDAFDLDSTNYLSSDCQFEDYEVVSKIYARIGQIIYLF